MPSLLTARCPVCKTALPTSADWPPHCTVCRTPLPGLSARPSADPGAAAPAVRLPGRQAPLDEPPQDRLSQMARGQLGLARTFWWYGTAIPLLATLAAALLLATLDLPGLAPLLTVLMLPYQLATMAGIWRAADRHTGAKHWAVLAQLCVGAGLLAGAVKLVSLLA